MMVAKRTDGQSPLQSIINSKSNKLAHVLYALGNLENTNGLSLLGVVEIENKIVLAKLLADPLIRKHHYKFIHFDSKRSERFRPGDGSEQPTTHPSSGKYLCDYHRMDGGDGNHLELLDHLWRQYQ